MIFKNKKILIGITGGIAAYKVCYLIRSIRKQGGHVKTILTKSGEQFIAKTTLESLSGEPVAQEIFDRVPTRTIQHIDLARWADCFVIAPATANCIAKTVHGIADNLLSTVILSYPGSILFAPAMNDEMWKNLVTQDNLNRLRELNHIVIPPGVGRLACDAVGIGRMAEPEEIEKAIIKRLGLKQDLKGKKILVTAGSTEEPIDPVRYISNRSSGKMGAALAEAAAARGAMVTLIVGAHTAHLPSDVEIIHALTAREMAKAVKKEYKKHDALIMAAAVADFRPVRVSRGKIKKNSAACLTLELERTEDILGSIGKTKGDTLIVGFSLETDETLKNARKKLTEKNLDMVVMNNPLEPGAGFEVDTNKVTILEKGKKVQELPLLPKREVAEHILDRVVKLLK